MILEYTVKKLSALAGVTTRTLRYYDEIGLLKPAKINSSGYRIYGQAEVKRLQQILFFKELGMELYKITEILDNPGFVPYQALLEHHQKLLDKKRQIEQLLTTVEKSLSELEGDYQMMDKERFEGFKKELIDENERRYGQEIRAKYGDEAVEKSYQNLKSMTVAEKLAIDDLTEALNSKLKQLSETKNVKGELGQEVYDLHRKWLTFYWNDYSVEAHRNIVEMYLADERFKAYYEKIGTGCAEVLRDAVLLHSLDRGTEEE